MICCLYQAGRGFLADGYFLLFSFFVLPYMITDLTDHEEIPRKRNEMAGMDVCYRTGLSKDREKRERYVKLMHDAWEGDYLSVLTFEGRTLQTLTRVYT